MRKFLTVIMIVAPFISQAVYATPKTIDAVGYVYVLEDGQSFDFASGVNHECGTNIYRTRADNPDVLNRKFSLVLTAYTARKRLTINTDNCDGNRLLFNWVRIHD